MKKIITIGLLVFLLQHVHAQKLDVTLSKTDRQCEAGGASVTVNGGTAPFQYEWSNGSVSSTATNLEAGTYTVAVRDAAMQDTAIVFTIAEQLCEPTVPNHFSPNGDGFYDTWNISGLNYFPDFELLVYNRWGQQVHRQVKQYTSWDGTQLGVALPDATYYYVIFLSSSDRHQLVKGDVSILR